MLAVLFAVFAAVYCLVRSLDDFRNKRYVWSAVGLCAAVALLFTPTEPVSYTFVMSAPEGSQ